MAAGSFQVCDQAGSGEDIGETGVGGAGTAHRTGGHDRKPVRVSKAGQGLGEGGVGGAAVQGELDGQADGGVSLHLCVTGSGAGAATAVGSGEELGEVAQAGVRRRQVPGTGPMGIAQSTTQGAVGGTSEDEAGSAGSPGLTAGGGAEGRGESGQVMGGFSAFSGVQVVSGDGRYQAVVADGVAGQDRQVGAVSKGELGAVNSGQAVGTTRLSMLDDAGNAIVIGEGEGLQTELDGSRSQVIGFVGSVEEGVGGVGVQLGVAVSAGHDYQWHLEC